VSRLKAAAIHLAISLALASTIGAILYFLWFPPPYFVAAGASRLMLVLMGVDIAIGPLLTLLAANPRKPKRLLKLDLSIIAALQALAFGYGIHVIAAARPIFVVAEADRFVLVSADEISDADLAQGSLPAFRRRSWTGPVLVGAAPPANKDGGDSFALQVMSTGKDIDRLPRYYMPYGLIVGKFMHHAKSLAELVRATADQRKQLQRLQDRLGEGPLVALPLQHGDRNFTIILSPRTKKPLRILPINSW
jgi:hypothetical protein